jgi:hypothetical protein
MSLIPVQVPDNVKSAVTQIEFFLRPGDPSPRVHGHQRYWQRVLNLGLQDLAKGQMATAPAGWRYLIGIRSGDALYATIDSQGKMTGLSRGPEATVAFRAAQEIRTLPEAADIDYEPWVLTIPGLLTECFWLKSPGGGNDVVVPFFTSQALRSGHAYSIDKFLKIMRPLAEERLRPEDDLRAKEGKRDEAKFADCQKQAEARIAEENEIRLRTEERRCMAEKRQEEQQKKAATTRQEASNAALGRPPAEA